MAEEEAQEGLSIPLTWNVPPGLVSRYATNFVVQHSDHEFAIYFFEALPPLLIGEPSEVKRQLQQIGSISANCVAKVIVAAERMPQLIALLQNNLQVYRTRKGD